MPPKRSRHHASQPHTGPDEDEITNLDLWNSMNDVGKAKTVRGLLDEGALSKNDITGLINDAPMIMEMALADSKVEDPLVRMGNFARELMGDQPPIVEQEPQSGFDPGPGIFGWTEEDWARIRRGEAPPPGRFQNASDPSQAGEGILRVPPQQVQRAGQEKRRALPAALPAGAPPSGRVRVPQAPHEPFAILKSFLADVGLPGIPPNAPQSAAPFSFRPTTFLQGVSDGQQMQSAGRLASVTENGAQQNGEPSGQQLAANERTPVHGGGGTGAGGYNALGGSGRGGGSGGGGGAARAARPQVGLKRPAGRSSRLSKMHSSASLRRMGVSRLKRH